MGRRIIAILMLVLTVALATVPSFADEAVSLTELDLTTIEEDFTGEGGANFDTQKFIDNLEDPTKPEVAIVREYWQRFKVSNPITWLYVYLYVPYGIEGGMQNLPDKIDIALASSFDEHGVPLNAQMFESEIVDRTDDGKFYKCKVDATGVYKMINSKRVYSVTAVYYRSDNAATSRRSFFEERDYRNYLFTGSDLNGDLNVEFEYEKMLDLDTVLKRYRTESSSKGDYWHNDVFYVYFSIPNHYEEKYDDIAGIEYKYFECLTNGFVCNYEENDIYNYAKQMLDLKFDSYVKDVPSLYINKYGVLSPTSTPSGEYIWHNEFVLNHFLSDIVVDNVVTEIANVKHVEDWEKDGEIFFLEKEDNFLGYAQDGFVYGDNHEKIKPTEKISVESMFGGYPDFIKWLYDAFHGYEDNVIEDYDVVNRCIEKITDSFFDGEDDAVSFSKNNMIEMDDIDDIRDFYNKAKADNETMYIMRLPKTRDYYAAPASLMVKGGYNSFLKNENGLYFQGTAITQFNIISFDFVKDGLLFKVLVDNDEQDFEFPVTGSQDKDADNFEEAVKNGLSGIGDFFKDVGDKTDDFLDQLKELLKQIAKIIAIVLIVVLVLALLPMMIPLFSVIGNAFGAVFRGIGKLFKRKNKDKDNERKDE